MRCDHTDGLAGVRCIAPAVHHLEAAPHVAYCAPHFPRALRLAVLEAAVTAERRARNLPTPGVISCPPNALHGGTVEWQLAGHGNACPVCGRYA